MPVISIGSLCQTANVCVYQTKNKSSSVSLQPQQVPRSAGQNLYTHEESLEQFAYFKPGLKSAQLYFNFVHLFPSNKSILMGSFGGSQRRELVVLSDITSSYNSVPSFIQVFFFSFFFYVLCAIYSTVPDDELTVRPVECPYYLCVVFTGEYIFLVYFKPCDLTFDCALTFD